MRLKGSLLNLVASSAILVSTLALAGEKLNLLTVQDGVFYEDWEYEAGPVSFFVVPGSGSESELKLQISVRNPPPSSTSERFITSVESDSELPATVDVFPANYYYQPIGDEPAGVLNITKGDGQIFQGTLFDSEFSANPSDL